MIKKIYDNILLRNIIVFALCLSFYVLVDMSAGTSGRHIMHTVYNIASVYIYWMFHNLVLYEYFLAKKKYVLYILLFLSTIVFWHEVTCYLDWLIFEDEKIKYALFKNIEDLWTKNRTASWLYFYWTNAYHVYISLAFYFLLKYIRQQERLLKIQNIQRQQELKHLNEQLNPHFLFNALNNIYSHTMGRGKDAGSLILKLAATMRYILDNSKKNTVPLSEEIAFLENYMVFEMERVGTRCNVVYDKNISHEQFQIVPLILFNFVENAFKHGTRSHQQSKIQISIYADEYNLELHVQNPINSNDRLSTKTGLDNTSRRLDLLYPGKHTLVINNSQNTYEVILKLKNQVE